MSHEREIVRNLLERDLVERPELRLVWADLLQLDGDPLGRLVLLDHVGATAPAELASRARAEADALREQLHDRLWQDPPPPIPGVELHWSLGFVRELRIEAAALTHQHTPRTWRWEGRRRRYMEGTMVDTIQWLVPALVRQPALRWLEVLRIEIDDTLARAAGSCLGRATFASPVLREIHIGSPASARQRPGGSWEPHPEAGGWLDASSLRQLRWVSSAGELTRLPACEGNGQARVHHLRGLAKQAWPWSRVAQASLARALWDASSSVREAAFTIAAGLGPAAAFLLPDLAWFLRPPLSRKDPRPAAVLGLLASIGPASAELLPEARANLDELRTTSREPALRAWLERLGPAGAALLASLGASQPQQPALEWDPARSREGP